MDEILKYLPIITAVCLHLFLRIAIFIEPPIKSSYATSILASYIIYLSLCVIIRDFSVFSNHNKQKTSVLFQLFIQFIFNLALMELVMIHIWYKIEIFVHSMVILIGTIVPDRFYNCDFIQGLIVLSLSIFVCFNIILITDTHIELLDMWTKIQKQMLQSDHKQCCCSMCGKNNETTKDHNNSDHECHLLLNSKYNKQKCNEKRNQITVKVSTTEVNDNL